MPAPKILLITILFLCCSRSGFAQDDSTPKKLAESTRTAAPVLPVPSADTVPKIIVPVHRKKSPDSNVVRSAHDTVRHDTSALRTQFLTDSLHRDSLRKAAVKVITKDTSTYRKYEQVKFLGLDKPAKFMLADFHMHEDKDELFYVMAGLLFCLAFIKTGFPKYFRNLFLLFFQTSLRQKQTRDQLLQDNLASLMINLLFFISTALYLTLLIRYKNWTPTAFWVLCFTSAAALALIYLGKYLFLRFAGWVFNSREAAGSYIFLVFMINKVMGVLLVPFVLLLAFASLPVVNVAVSISVGLVGLLFVYRYLVSFNAIRSKLKVNVLHFFLYLCAVEILPLLLIYKLLVNYFGGSI